MTVRATKESVLPRRVTVPLQRANAQAKNNVHPQETSAQATEVNVLHQKMNARLQDNSATHLLRLLLSRADEHRNITWSDMKTNWNSPLNFKQKIDAAALAYRVSENVLEQLDSERNQIKWTPLENCYLAILNSNLGTSRASNYYFKTAHSLISNCSRDNEECKTLSLFGGFAQFGLALHCLSLNQGGYDHALINVDTKFIQCMPNYLQRIKYSVANDDLRFQDYDVVSGLSGILAFLLLRTTSDIRVRPASIECAQLLIWMVGSLDGIFKFGVKKENTKEYLADYDGEHKVVNCGVSHGIAGVLSVLSLARSADIDLQGLDQSIDDLTEWLLRSAHRDKWGAYWPHAVPISSTFESTVSVPRMVAWCYGSLGISRAIWLAGKALDRAYYRDFALANVLSTVHSFERSKQIVYPGLCHGLAGRGCLYLS